MIKLYHFVRFLMTILFLTTAVGKLLDNRGFAEVIATYQFGFSNELLLGLALFVSLLEFYFAIQLGRNRHPLANAWFTVFAHGGYLILAASSLMRGLNLDNCGCFGVFWARPLRDQTVIEDAVLLAISLLFLWLTRRYQAKSRVFI